MRARAPGKLVLSGAYAVLEGAPALVAAVDRYVVADSERPATIVTGEVQQACAQGHLERASWFDATALRRGDRKLGLGSSAAILAATLGAAASHRVADEQLAEHVLPLALAAHRAEQPGGSGIDVAAVCRGGVLACRLDGEELAISDHCLPDGLSLEVWACPQAASTQRMLAAVSSLKQADAPTFRALIDEACAGARAAIEAADVPAFLEALRRQHAALGALGAAAGIPIVTAEVAALAKTAGAHGACFGPAGAGGGDVAVHYGIGDSSQQFRSRAAEAGLCLVEMGIGARGLHRVDDTRN